MPDEIQKPKIFIATPMYGGMCAGFYTQSIIQLLTTCQANGVDAEFSFMFNESLITRARNSLVHTFLKTDCSHLMFIDSDIKFRASDVIHMIRADKDILCGIYPKKEINWHTVKAAFDRGVSIEDMKFNTGSFVVNLVNYAGEVTVPMHEPVEIFNGGTGFMLIKRDVFNKLGESVPSYSNDVVDLGGKMKQSEPIKEFFTTSIEPGTNRLLSEDYHFCRIWRESGGQVHAAPWCQLAHIGTYTFEGQLLQSS